MESWECLCLKPSRSWPESGLRPRPEDAGFWVRELVMS